jgi:hypothetical protein
MTKITNIIVNVHEKLDVKIENLVKNDASSCGRFKCLKQVGTKVVCAALAITASVIAVLSLAVFVPLFAVASLKDVIFKTPINFDRSKCHPNSWGVIVVTVALALPIASAKLAKYVINGEVLR